METDGLKLDVGAYAKALEYACDTQSIVIGKPNTEYFAAAVADMQLNIEEVSRYSLIILASSICIPKRFNSAA